MVSYIYQNSRYETVKNAKVPVAVFIITIILFNYLAMSLKIGTIVFSSLNLCLQKNHTESFLKLFNNSWKQVQTKNLLTKPNHNPLEVVYWLCIQLNSRWSWTAQLHKEILIFYFSVDEQGTKHLPLAKKFNKISKIINRDEIIHSEISDVNRNKL